jgi:DNA-binding NarL/FixJ family response regulator
METDAGMKFFFARRRLKFPAVWRTRWRKANLLWRGGGEFQERGIYAASTSPEISALKRAKARAPGAGFFPLATTRFFCHVAVMPAKISVLIVDDHPLFRSGLRSVIASDARFELAGEAGDGETALQFILEKKPAVAVLDLNLPKLSGLDVARRLQAKKSATRLIVLTMHKEEEMIHRALDAGVGGFVLKDNAADDILDAIQAVADGGNYLSPAVSGVLIKRRSRAQSLVAEKPGLKGLTNAEQRILKLIAGKKSTKEIAAELFISPRTVEAHRANICAKLDLHGANSLLQFAIENRAAL